MESVLSSKSNNMILAMESYHEWYDILHLNTENSLYYNERNHEGFYKLEAHESQIVSKVYQAFQYFLT